LRKETDILHGLFNLKGKYADLVSLLTFSIHIPYIFSYT